MKYGLVTKDGTCASETVLCKKHFIKENKKAIYDSLSDDIKSVQFRNVSSNEYAKCVVCRKN